MSYIWEDYSEKSIFSISPVSEASDEEAVFNSTDNTVYINPKSRFSSLLNLDRANTSDYQNLLFHYLAQLDLRCGHYIYDKQHSAVISEIHNGKYGSEVNSLFEQLNQDHKTLLATAIIAYRNSNNINNMFFPVFKQIFNIQRSAHNNYAEIFYDENNQIHYCFCAINETPYFSNLFKLMVLLFANITEQYIPIWGVYCFGILDSTVYTVPIIDQFQIIE